MVTVQAAIKEYLVECEVRRYTPKTIKGYRTALNIFQQVLSEIGVTDIEDVTMASVKKFQQILVGKKHKGTYINSLLKASKSFISYCFSEGIGGFNTQGRAYPWVKQDKPVIKAFSPKDVRILLGSCKGNDFLDVRDCAIITTLFETGIRCAELYSIKPEHIHDDYILIANGKNHKQRVVPISAPLRKAMLRFDRVRENYFSYKTVDDYYFLSFHGKQLTNSAVEHILKRRGEGIDDVRVSPHTCRHTWAQAQIRMGTDLYTISRLLGHENIRITQIYLESLRDEDIIKMSKNKSVLQNL